MSRLLLVLLLSLLTATSAMTDTATGIAFAPKLNGLDIFGVGVRKKGPFKVYSVGMYGSSAVKSKLASISKTSVSALKELQNESKANDTTFLLEMSFKVGAEKMASAIADSVSPRFSGSDPSSVAQLEALIIKGVAKKGAAKKGTKFQFDCKSSGVDVTVDGKKQGSVQSKELAQAFCDVYLDDQCVSPPLRQSCLLNCFGV